MKKNKLNSNFLGAFLFFLAVSLIVSIIFVAISPGFKKNKKTSEVVNQGDRGFLSSLKTQVYSQNELLEKINFNSTNGSYDENSPSIISVSQGAFLRQGKTFPNGQGVVGISVLIKEGYEYLMNNNGVKISSSNWVLDGNSSGVVSGGGGEYRYSFIAKELVDASVGDIINDIRNSNQSENFLIFDFDKTRLVSTGEIVNVEFDIEFVVVGDQSNPPQAVIFEDQVLTMTPSQNTGSSSVRIDSFSVRGSSANNNGLGEVGDEIVLSWMIVAENSTTLPYFYVEVKNLENNSILNLTGSSNKASVSNFQINDSNLIWKPSFKNNFEMKVCADNNCAVVFDEKRFYVNTIDCSSMIRDNVDDGFFTVNDLTAIQNALLVGGSGNSEENGPRRDLNGNGSFDIADLVSAAQCLNCIWNWKGCSE